MNTRMPPDTGKTRGSPNESYFRAGHPTGWSVVVGSPFVGLVVLAGEELLAVAAAAQEDEAVQVVAQVLDAVAGVAGRDH
jgi:hypothetical protein